MVVDINDEASTEAEQTGALDTVALENDDGIVACFRLSGVVNTSDVRERGVRLGDGIGKDYVDRMPKLLEDLGHSE